VRVEFYNGTTLIGSDTTPPYELVWNNVPAGAYTVFAKTVASNGAEAISKPADIFVGTGVPTPTSVVSRKTHGPAGARDITLPLTGTPGIECRSGGANSDYQVIFTFPSSVTFNSAAVSSGTGTVSSSSGSGTTAVTVNLTGVTSAQRLTLTLSNVSNGPSAGDLAVQMGVLVGDTNGDGFVNAGDAVQSRNRSGQATDATNFRSDMNFDGFVNSGDAIGVRSRSGTALP
jgi:hypothetical protein